MGPGCIRKMRNFEVAWTKSTSLSIIQSGRASENIFRLQCKCGSSKWASPHHKQFATFLRNFYIFKQLLGNFEIWASVRRTLFSDTLQSGAIIRQYNITWYFIHHCNDWGRIQIRVWTHKRQIDHVITAPHCNKRESLLELTFLKKSKIVQTRTTRMPAFWGYPRRIMITHTTESNWIPSQKKTK